MAWERCFCATSFRERPNESSNRIEWMDSAKGVCICMGQRRYIPELTGLRGVAALAVVISHLPLVLPVLKDSPFSAVFAHLSMCGMSLFFVLSGIVIWYNYADRIAEDLWSGCRVFLLARFARLYPLYFLFILFFIILQMVFAKPGSHELSAGFTAAPLFLLGLQSWHCGFIDGKYLTWLFGGGNISWSISTEFALYLVFIPIVRVIAKRVNVCEKCFMPLILLIVAIVGHAFWVFLWSRSTPVVNWLGGVFSGQIETIKVHYIYHSPFSRIFEFLAGCSIAMMISLGKSLKDGYIYFTRFLVMVGVVIVCVFPLKAEGFDHILTSALMVIFCMVFALNPSLSMRSSIFQFIGDVSYSAYLLHIVVVIFVNRIKFVGMWGQGFKIVLYFCVTYILAWLCYNWFETPMRKRIRGG